MLVCSVSPAAAVPPRRGLHWFCVPLDFEGLHKGRAALRVEPHSRAVRPLEHEVPHGQLHVPLRPTLGLQLRVPFVVVGIWPRRQVTTHEAATAASFPQYGDPNGVLSQLRDHLLPRPLQHSGAVKIPGFPVAPYDSRNCGWLAVGEHKRSRLERTVGVLVLIAEILQRGAVLPIAPSKLRELAEILQMINCSSRAPCCWPHRNCGI